MKALVFDGTALAERLVPRPRPRRGEALIKVRCAGICSTDIEILRGYMSFRGIPGHEFVGTVVSSSPRRLAGSRVVGEINLSCGSCPLCRAGLGTHCTTRSVLGIQGRNGAFAEYLALPVKNLHIVPPSLSDEEAAFTELVAAACEIPAQVDFRRSHSVYVLGDGRLAAMVAQVVRLKTKKVAVLGIDRDKLERIAAVGIETRDLKRRHGKLDRRDFVIDCTGSPEGLPLAAELVRPRGTIILKSTYQGTLEWNPAPIAVNEITVMGSRCGPFDTALDLLERRKIEVLPFLSAVYPLGSWEAAFRRARAADAFKVLIRIA